MYSVTRVEVVLCSLPCPLFVVVVELVGMIFAVYTIVVKRVVINAVNALYTCESALLLLLSLLLLTHAKSRSTLGLKWMVCQPLQYSYLYIVLSTISSGPALPASRSTPCRPACSPGVTSPSASCHRCSAARRPCCPSPSSSSSRSSTNLWTR